MVILIKLLIIIIYFILLKIMHYIKKGMIKKLCLIINYAFIILKLLY